MESTRTLALPRHSLCRHGDEDAATDHHRERRHILTDLGLNPA